MILITGDIHAQTDRVLDLADKYYLENEDTVILLGDVGMNYFGNYHDKLV